MKVYGWPRFTEQLLSRIQADVESSISEAQGDSEIERLLFHAVRVTANLGMSHHAGLVELTDEARHLYVDGSHTFFYSRQAQLDNWRVDFLFQCFNNDAKSGLRKWQKLIVECDGHQFHERTKEQAARDRSRDRWAVESGYDIFRFTGSEIWSDPLGCADQIHNWAARYWA